MGYYTYFQIKITKTRRAAEIKDRLEEISAYKFQEATYNDEYEITSDDTIKWYSFDDNMNQLSLEFPEALFQVDGNGEEDDDIWRTYFMNGNSQSVEVKTVYGKLNMKKLKEPQNG